jgi:CHAT domain-containing protein
VALAAAEESVRLARTSGDPDLEVRAFVRWVRAAREVDQDRQIDFAPALALAESVEDLSAGALVATHGSVYMHYRGRLRESFELGLLAHRLAEQSGDVPSQISGLQNIAGSYLSTGDAALAQSYFERAYDLAVRAGFHVVTVSALTAIAECLFVTGNKEAAHQLDAESACELERAGEWFNASTVRSRMVNHHIAEGDLDAAERELAHAQRDAANAHAQARSAVWDQAEAPLRLAQGRYREALEAMDSSVEYPSASVRQLRARILSALGRFEEAEYELLLSLQDIEIMRAEVVAEPRQLRHFMGNWSGVYAQLTDLLADCGRTDEALAMAESLRANVLRDVLAGGAVGSTSAGDGAERRRLAETEARLVRLNRQASSRRPEHLRHAIELTRLELADLSARIAAAHPESPRRELPTPASRSGDTLYLSYTVTEQRTLVLLTRGTRVERTVFLPVARKELEAKVARFARQLERRDLNAVASARDLYRVLLQPLQPELGRARRICIVPDGELWRVPFHALRAPGGRWLAELATISYAPSVTLGITLSGASPRRDSSILLLGDASGSLPAANDEVRRVAALYGSRAALFADRATEAAFKAEAGRHETIHIAAHAEIDRGSPMYSAVVVSPGAEDEDGRIEARELAQLDLRDKLVVLSACATATGETRTAEGIVGLPWALMAAGARESVLSAWNVDSAATASLMDAFHRHLLQSPSRPAAEALRRAQLELLRRPEYSHPYYWAAFQVIGGQ